jgi:hypothetical protein
MNYTLAQINAMEQDGRITPLMAASARLRIAAMRLNENYDDIRAGIAAQKENDRKRLEQDAKQRDATNRKGRL